MTGRIGLVIGQLGYGGAEKQLCLLAEALAAEGEEVSVFCLSEILEPYGRRLAEAGVPVFSMPRSRHYEPGRVLKLARQLRSRRIEIVHSFLETANIYSYLAGPLAARPVQVPSVRSLPARMPLLKRRLHEKALGSAALVCANSQAGAAAWADRYGIDRDRFRVVYNGVEAAGRITEQVRLEARRRFKLRSFNPVIGTAGKDKPEKNLSAFLRLTVRLAEEGGGVCALVAGAGLDESYAARHQIERTSVCQAYLLGRLHQMDDFFAALDVFVLTSLSESLPNVILEAMAAGLPVVAYDVGGVGELVAHGRTGLLVKKGDEEGLYEAVRRLIQNREEAKKMGEEGWESARREFTVGQMAEQCRVMYKAAVSVERNDS